MKTASGNRLSLAVGELVWTRCRSALAELECDLVAPVPMHWRRRLAHGTNSAAVLGEVLAKRLRKPLAERLLRRHRNTLPQFDLSPSERRENVRGAFAVRKGYSIEKTHVLLVDDIMTSGATCNEAARMLRRAGAGRISVIVVARAFGD
jgi:predicted amidophosphoribosyltransferase